MKFLLFSKNASVFADTGMLSVYKITLVIAFCIPLVWVFVQLTHYLCV